jgi:hypothetical protein
MTKEELDQLVRQSNSRSTAVRLAVARNPNSPADLLDRLSKDPDSKVRREVAWNPNCPADLLDRLSKDEYWGIRIAVAENPNCPIDLLVLLMRDEYIEEEATESLRSRKETASPEEKELIRAWETLAEIGVI